MAKDQKEESSKETTSIPPARQSDRTPLTERARFDFSDYGFVIDARLEEAFDIVPSRLDGEECFFFFFPLEDMGSGRFSLFNLHCFLKKTGSLDDFAHGLGPSMANISLDDREAFGLPARGYVRQITMANLFQGAPQVIDFIGGRPDMEVRDSHVYFMHRHCHWYTGMLHEPGDEARYDTLRERLMAGIKMV